MEKNYEIMLYSISIHGRNKFRLSYLTSTETRSSYEGWLELNVTKMLAKWHLKPASNEGLYVEVNYWKNIWKEEVEIANAGLAGMTSVDSEKPFMVGYFRNKEVIL